MTYQYPTVDIFQSFQGEGLRMGLQTLFIRLFGCNLKCAFCDEPLHLDSSKICKYDAESLVDSCIENYSIFKIPESAICFTGGEPLIHPIAPLIELFSIKSKTVIQIETNGTQEIPLPGDWRSFVHVTAAPKEACEFTMHDTVWYWANEIKLVCNVKNGEDIITFFLEKYRSFLKRFEIPIFIQPENKRGKVHKRNLKKSIELANKYGLHVSPQLHKLLGVA